MVGGWGSAFISGTVKKTQATVTKAKALHMKPWLETSVRVCETKSDMPKTERYREEKGKENQDAEMK